MRVAFQGDRGCNSEAAARRFFGDRIVPLPRRTLRDVFDALAEAGDDADVVAVVPVENSSAGSIVDTFDLLWERDGRVLGEVYLPVRHALMALPGVPIDAIRRVVSHPKALAQCRNFLARLGVEAVPEWDTAGSARLVAERGWTDTAALAPPSAAPVHGLSILADAAEDAHVNTTRFLVVAGRRGELPGGGAARGVTDGAESGAASGAVEATASGSAGAAASGAGSRVANGAATGEASGAASGEASGAASGVAGAPAPASSTPGASALDSGAQPAVYKTTLAFVTRHEPGALHRALGAFASRNLNMTKIESRPVPERPWHFRFFVDVETGVGDAPMASALDELRRTCEVVRVFGTYRAARSGSGAGSGPGAATPMFR